MSERNVRLGQLMPLIEDTLRNGGTVQFTPEGGSMRPLIVGGRDSVELAPLPEELRRYDAVLYRRDNGQYVLHRILSEQDGAFVCMGDAQFVPERVRRDQMIAVVRSVTRKGKRTQAHAPKEQAFCMVWNGTRPIRRFFRRAYGWLKRRIGR